MEGEPSIVAIDVHVQTIFSPQLLGKDCSHEAQHTTLKLIFP